MMLRNTIAGYLRCVRFVYLAYLCLILCEHFWCAEALFERTCTSKSMRQRKGVCGADLSDLLSDVCIVYNKRDEPNTHPTRGPTQTPQSGLEGVFLTKHQAVAFLKNKRHTRHVLQNSITCECCYHRCGYYEITEYCARSIPSKHKRVEARPLSPLRSLHDVTRQIADSAQKQLIGREVMLFRGTWWDMPNQNVSYAGHFGDELWSKQNLETEHIHPSVFIDY